LEASSSQPAPEGGGMSNIENEFQWIGYRQSKNEFYVCVRLRDEHGGDPLMIERIPATSIRNAHKKLKDAIDKYGPTHKVVIEPAEFAIYEMKA